MTLLTLVQFRQAFDHDLIERLSTELSTSRGQRVPDTDIVEELIAQAASTVYGYLSNQYSTVQIDADASMRRVCCDLAIYYLYGRRSGEIPATITAAYERAMRYLSDLQTGLIRLAAVAQLLPTGDETYDDLYDDTGYFDD